MDFDAISSVLPQRVPFVLVDRVLALDVVERRIVCVKNVSGAEPIFGAHFPSRALLPGVLVLETMAQAALLLLDGIGVAAREGEVPVLAAADEVRWLRPVRPGDRILVAVTVERRAGHLAALRCVASVDEQEVARARLTVASARLEA